MRNPITLAWERKKRQKLADAFLELLNRSRPAGVEVPQKDTDAALAIQELVGRRPDLALFNTNGGLTLMYRSDADPLVGNMDRDAQKNFNLGRADDNGLPFLLHHDSGGLFRG